MMLAMALAHRQRATRAGGGWCREGSAQPPGLCTLLAAIALFLVLVGSATLGVERAVAAVENTRSDKLPAYNSAAMSWRLGGSAAVRERIAWARAARERRADAPRPAKRHILRRRGPGGDCGYAGRRRARAKHARVIREHPAREHAGRSVTRLHQRLHPRTARRFSHVLRRATKAGDESRRRARRRRRPRRRRSRRSRARRGRARARSPRAHRVDCDACATHRRGARPWTPPRGAPRATRRGRGTASSRAVRALRTSPRAPSWRSTTDDLAVADDHGDASFSSSFSVPLRRPTNAGCALRYHADVLSRAEWDTAAAVRAFCASTEGRGAPRLAPNRNDEIDEHENENENESLPLAVTVRSSRDPRVVAGALTRCSYDFGPSAREHASSAAFLLLLSFACVVAAAYWSRGRAACFPARLLEEGTDDGGGDGEIPRRAGPARYAAATRAVPEAERRDARIGGGREPLEARRPPPRAYVLEPSGRDRRRRERDSAAARRGDGGDARVPARAGGGGAWCVRSVRRVRRVRCVCQTCSTVV